MRHSHRFVKTVHPEARVVELREIERERGMNDGGEAAYLRVPFRFPRWRGKTAWRLDDGKAATLVICSDLSNLSNVM